MRQILISGFVIHMLSVQSWADCAWVLIEQKSFPEARLSDPYVSVMPHRYYESKKECDAGGEQTLRNEGNIKDQTFNTKLKWIERKDDKGREAYYRYACIPSNVLSLYIRAEH